MAKILLGFNCNCFTNRYDEPQEWARICAELGIKHVMFNIDLIDPYWPWDLQKRICDETLEACDKYGVQIKCSFGGHHGHQHYLGHPDQEVRRQSEYWFKRCIDQTAYLGGSSFGTCFAIQTVKTHNNPQLRTEIIEDAIQAYHRLAEHAAQVGLEALAYEMTSVPRETCATFDENDYILEKCSKMAVPMKICLDVGHRNLSGDPREADHLEWIRRYGSRCDVIDCQQTDLSASHHWPFTPEFNESGIINPDEVVNAIQDSGASEILLGFEIKTSAYYPQEYSHLENLKISVDYWRKWVKY
jgi:sugar phosphate isomerase/epimerase